MQWLTCFCVSWIINVPDMDFARYSMVEYDISCIVWKACQYILSASISTTLTRQCHKINKTMIKSIELSSKGSQRSNIASGLAFKITETSSAYLKYNANLARNISVTKTSRQNPQRRRRSLSPNVSCRELSGKYR